MFEDFKNEFKDDLSDEEIDTIVRRHLNIDEEPPAVKAAESATEDGGKVSEEETTDEEPAEVVVKRAPLVKKCQELDSDDDSDPDEDEDIDNKVDPKESDKEVTAENSTKEPLAVKAAESTTEGNLAAAIDDIVNQAVAAVQSITISNEKPSENGKTDVKKPKKTRRLKNSPLKEKEKAFAGAAKL